MERKTRRLKFPPNQNLFRQGIWKEATQPQVASIATQVEVGNLGLGPRAVGVVCFGDYRSRTKALTDIPRHVVVMVIVILAAAFSGECQTCQSACGLFAPKGDTFQSCRPPLAARLRRRLRLRRNIWSKLLTVFVAVWCKTSKTVHSRTAPRLGRWLVATESI